MNLYHRYGVRLSTIVIFFATLLSGFYAAADELLMKDGSRLLGQVVKKDDGASIDFKTTYAGVIKVKWTEVSKLTTDEPMTILLKSGVTREVSSAKNTESGIVVVRKSGETETIPGRDVGYVNPEPWRLGEGWKWTGNTNAALNYERGNSEKDEYEVDFDAMFRRIDDRLKFFGDYNRENKNDVLTDDDWRLNGRYDHFVNTKFYYGVTLGLDHDRFADRRLRTIVGPLAGYEFYESKMMNFDVAAGPTYVSEDFYDEDDREYASIGWQVDFDLFLIPDRVQFYHRHQGLLEVEDVDNLTWNAWTGFLFPIYGGVVVSTELLLEYDGTAAEDVDDTETTFKVKLGYKW
jgi:putative salt-induced outer membrane protein YdiY